MASSIWATRSVISSIEPPMAPKVSRACSTVGAPSSVRRAPVSTTATALPVSAWISPIRPAIDRGGLLGLLGQLADLVGDDREAAALLAGAGGLDRGVERQEVRLLGDGGDRVDDPADLARTCAPSSRIAPVASADDSRTAAIASVAWRRARRPRAASSRARRRRRRSPRRGAAPSAVAAVISSVSVLVEPTARTWRSAPARPRRPRGRSRRRRGPSPRTWRPSAGRPTRPSSRCPRPGR